MLVAVGRYAGGTIGATIPHSITTRREQSSGGYGTYTLDTKDVYQVSNLSRVWYGAFE